jgi:hypothetical protein
MKRRRDRETTRQRDRETGKQTELPSVFTLAVEFSERQRERV